MKICVAQTRSVAGDIQRNIDQHKKLIDLAIAEGADIIVFPELSITGYEPELAKELATTPADNRFDDFQGLSDANQIIIGVGMPTTSESGILISMIIFQPYSPRQLYAKQHIHPDEEAYFAKGQRPVQLQTNDRTIALAICYELAVPDHAENAYQCGAGSYIASVAKTIDGVEKASNRLMNVANTYAMTVLMANCVGPCDKFESAGKSSIWNNKGELVGQLNDTDEGILMIDTYSQELIKRIL